MKKWITGSLALLCLLLFMLPVRAKAATDYTDLNVPDTLKWSLLTVDGESIDEKTYEGKLRCFLFIQNNCINSSLAVKYLADREWLSNEDIQVIAVFSDGSSKEQMENFINTYAPNNKNIVFAHGASDKMMNFYIRNNVKDKQLVFAMAAVVDKTNVLRRAINQVSLDARDFFKDAIDKYLYKIEEKDLFTFDINGTFDYDEATEVFKQLNTLRQSLGLKPLVMDKDLMDTAMQRAAEISIYYSHTRPNGDEPYTIFPKGYKTAGENIAYGYTNPTAVMTGWTNSPGHYRNMTNSAYEAAGIGCFYQDGVKYWVQLFDSGRSTTADTRSGKTVKNTTISAKGSNLNIYIKSASLDVGSTLQEKFELINENKNGERCYTRIVHKVYSSSDKSLATIDANGTVTGIKAGDVWITLGINDKVYWRTLVHVLNNYTFTYDANGGTGAPEPQIKLHNRTLKITSQEPVRPGYRFVGWSTNPKAYSMTDYGANGTVEAKINQDMYFYAVWWENYYYIEYNANGGTGYLAITTQIGDTPVYIGTQTPTRAGYQFMGWAKSKDATVAEYQPGDKVTVFENITLYAVWSNATKTYTVTYDANGGVGAPEPQIKIHGQNLRLSSTVPAKPGMNFAGWGYGPNDNPSYQAGEFYVINNDVTFYAIWKTPTKTYSVSFIDWDGKVLSEQTVEEGKAAVAPANPTRTGYKFTGWNQTFTNVNGNLIIIAQYQYNTSTPQNNTPTTGTYGITTDPAGELVMTPVVEGNYIAGYYTVKVINTGTKSTGTLKVSLSGPNASSFEISKTSIVGILAGKEGQILVKPKLLLKAGTYTATITISGTNIPETKLKVSLTVNSKSSTNTKPVITINSQPAATTTVSIGQIKESIKVTASVSNGATPKYQWYSRKTESGYGTKINGATSNTFKIPTDLKEGTYLYYCLITSDNAKEVRTINAKVVVKYKDKPVITIDSQPPEVITVTQGKINEKLIVAASVTNGKTLKYQWAVSKTGKNPPTGTKITGATTKSFTVPSNLKPGTYYYFCVLTADGAKEVRTNVTKVIVKK